MLFFFRLPTLDLDVSPKIRHQLIYILWEGGRTLKTLQRKFLSEGEEKQDVDASR